MLFHPYLLSSSFYLDFDISLNCFNRVERSSGGDGGSSSNVTALAGGCIGGFLVAIGAGIAYFYSVKGKGKGKGDVKGDGKSKGTGTGTGLEGAKGDKKSVPGTEEDDDDDDDDDDLYEVRIGEESDFVASPTSTSPSTLSSSGKASGKGVSPSKQSAGKSSMSLSSYSIIIGSQNLNSNFTSQL